MAKVSIIIPSRNEQFLPNTIDDIYKNARGDFEVIAVLEGYWPDPPLKERPNLIQIHHGKARGMRPAINAACEAATGEYLLKIDAHCMVGEGFDEILKQDIDDNMIVIPRRYRLDAENWCIQDDGKPPIDYHYLSYPFERENDRKCGLHGTIWPQRAKERAEILFDEEMSSQGSCWFMTRKHRDRLGDMDFKSYGSFQSEFQELGNKTWLGGGRCMVNKKTWYAHLHKGAKYGRGYWISRQELSAGSEFATRHWMMDEWAHRVHDMRWLIERFAPVPGWPEDLDEAFRYAHDRLKKAA